MVKHNDAEDNPINQDDFVCHTIHNLVDLGLRVRNELQLITT